MKIEKTLLLVLALFSFTITFSQDLEPRVLSRIPVGGNFAIASYGYSQGNILVDNTIPIEGLNASLHNGVVAYARSFKLLNRLAKVDAVVPYSYARFNAKVQGIDSTVYRNGFADPMLRLSMILIGAKPLSPTEFIKAERKKFSLGIFARVKLPVGNYDNTKLLNIGANRWGLKTGIGASYTVKKKLVLELVSSYWFFTENSDFFNGNTVKQEPILSLQLHATYVFKPGVWLALSTGRAFFGETSINGVDKNNPQNNSRFGAVFAYRLNKRNALKFAFTSGITSRYGANFTNFIVAYQFFWFDKRKEKNQ